MSHQKPGMNPRALFSGLMASIFMVIFFLCVLMVFTQCSRAAQITLSFQDNAENEDGFYVERKDPGSTVFVRVATLPSLAGKSPPRIEWTDQGLQPLSVYSYRVRAFNIAGQSLPTSIVSVKTQSDALPVTLPPSPTLPEAKPSNP